ncbi:unnamed protein product [Arctia plantaginis]|uniref:Uncharacterized protein n=1 Tax=Arctia plantaginis TaxID=874455 RepID=A0A8S1ABX4_ARCPL|nr:unnamed protein product [Arctia plantaginis]
MVLKVLIWTKYKNVHLRRNSVEAVENIQFKTFGKTISAMSTYFKFIFIELTATVATLVAVVEKCIVINGFKGVNTRTKYKNVHLRRNSVEAVENIQFKTFGKPSPL